MKCEICHCEYIALGVHLRHKHQIDPDEYREEYGLMKTTPLVDPELSAQLTKGAKARLLDLEYLAEMQEMCKVNSLKHPQKKGMMSTAGRARLATVNKENNGKYLKAHGEVVKPLLDAYKTKLDVYRAIGMGPKAVQGIADMGLASYSLKEAIRIRNERAALTQRRKAQKRVEALMPLLETTGSAAEMCRKAGISIRTYKNWLAAGLIPRHPNGRKFTNLTLDTVI